MAVAVQLIAAKKIINNINQAIWAAFGPHNPIKAQKGQPWVVPVNLKQVNQRRAAMLTNFALPGRHSNFHWAFSFFRRRAFHQWIALGKIGGRPTALAIK